ncbi:peptide chain release factor H [Pleionea sediminis]|uniref:peptide chain release factor H n=1 Tax=Pleionea sediminis TaxID=2569479 RepID=UPI00118666BB|nr:peptide chain release factor H [Pleionea sediminis]
MKLLLLSAAQGPAECCLAVSLAAKRLQREAESNNIRLSLVEEQPGLESDTYKSLLYKLEGDAVNELTKNWQGSFKWICPSPFRNNHKRKNWFFTGRVLIIDMQRLENELTDDEFEFMTCRASGPGGQHVNKTNSAVKATHIPSGLSVKVQSERSQHANKRLAKALIQKKRLEIMKQKESSEKSRRRLMHHSIERGNAVRVFKGMDFKEEN